MKNTFTLKHIIIGLVILFVVMQFFRIDKTNPQSDPADDFIAHTDPPTGTAIQIKESCYDCHSNNTRYPWYADVAPASWIIGSHIEDGRKHLNFSEWGKYDKERRKHKLDEIVEEVEEGNMPMSGYVLIHGDAELTGEQKESFINWFKTATVVSKPDSI